MSEPAGRIPRDHFNQIAEKYFEEIPSHIREHLIGKWWDIVSPYFDTEGKILDVGCGDGLNVKYLVEKGLDVHGFDFSGRLIESGKSRFPALDGRICEGNALDMAYDDNAFSTVYMIGVLHHIYTREDQLQAIHEALRVVRPGGRVVIRESNLKNPLFRIFWNYVFPLTNRIDLFGGEHWIATRYYRRWGLPTEAIHYFTFLPSFTSRRLLPLASRLESFLENTPLRSMAAHYTIVLRKPR